jgi:acetylornithine deacetylase/succinyl-diaminopimelate desuccinylase-like protein
VDSPAWRLCEALVSIRNAGLAHHGSRLPHPAVLDALAALQPPTLPAGSRAGLRPSDYWTQVCTQPSLNASGLEAGYVGPGFKTSIPDRAIARLDVRLVPGQDPLEVYDLIAAHLERLDLDVTIRRIASTPPAQTDPDHPWPTIVADHLEGVYGERPVILPVLPGTVPMGVLVGSLQLPTVVVPHANADQLNHAPDENLVLGSLQRGARTVARLLLAMDDRW